MLMALLQSAASTMRQRVSMNQAMRARRIATVIAIAEMMELQDRRNGDADTIMTMTTTTTTGTTILMTIARERGGGGVRMHTRKCRNLKVLGRNRKDEPQIYAQSSYGTEREHKHVDL